ncbi:alpha/beta fold hydrolase [Phaeobacter marinintestinus]|uniref:alpha/beta fold hydrolase n=1 Tax=Falsiphaeobacter marinintestinus TaxID=1492905 RepID=UPI0011B6EEBE|nr:alpha/beta fold hydrolase [Phaeobacter marinintestinus]
MTDTPITGDITGVGGTRISYRIDGPEGAPWLILSNSLATNMSMWDPQMPALSASRRVVRYDQRGHGASAPAAPPYTVDQLAGDVIALMDHLGIESTDFMGLSLGGMTGLGLAIHYGPRINRVVCADARADAPAAYQGIWDTNIAKLHESGISALCETTLGRWFTQDFLDNPENADMLDDIRTMIRGTAPQGYEGVGRFLQSLDLLPGIPSITCPVLYVGGENDMAAPVDVMQNMADQTADGRMVVIPGAAHLSNMEKPDVYLNAVSGFLGLD